MVNQKMMSNLGPHWSEPLGPHRSNKHHVNYAYAYIAACSLIEPQTYEQATSSDNQDDWQQAMDEEYASLIKNKTWDIVLLPKG